MNVELTQDQIESLLRGISIPTQPQILVDLQMEQLDPHCSLKRIAELISQDVGLSGSILKTVNSPFYELSNKIGTVMQAVNILGINTVVNLVNAHSIKGSLSDEQIVALGKFWDCAIDIAQASVSIARHLGVNSPDESYTLGLFHNCGIPLMMQRYPNYAEVMHTAYGQADEPINKIENRLLQTNHCVVGYYVAKSWKLPRYLCEAIHDHHNAVDVIADDRADARKRTLLAVLKIAEHLCGNYRHLGEQSEDYEWQRLSTVALEYVGLSQYDFETMTQHLRDLGLCH